MEPPTSRPDPRRHLYDRDPSFGSVTEFVAFVKIVYDRWSTPSPPSTFAAQVEPLRLGTRVDTSRPPPQTYEPTEICHVRWVGTVLRTVRRCVARPAWRAWYLSSFIGEEQSDIGDRLEVEQQTVSDWTIRVRDRVAEELRRWQMM